METLLQIKTSIFSGNGASSRLTDQFVSDWQAQHPRGRVIVRDLAAAPIPHLTAERFLGFSSTEPRTAEQDAALALSDELIAELRQADVIVIGLPLYNFGVPSTLKAYFDHIARAGVTFKFTSQGAVGQLLGKRVIVVSTRGGVSAGTPSDTQTAFVRDFLGFLGMTDVEFIHAEGLSMSAHKEQGLSSAATALNRLAAAVPPAALVA